MKPENILLKNKFGSQLVLSDFGFATTVFEQQKLFWRCGTPGFAAPEVIQNKVYCNKVDIFSAGVIMFLMMSGQMPFFSSNYDEMLMLNEKAIIDYSPLARRNVDN